MQSIFRREPHYLFVTFEFLNCHHSPTQWVDFVIRPFLRHSIIDNNPYLSEKNKIKETIENRSTLHIIWEQIFVVTV